MARSRLEAGMGARLQAAERYSRLAPAVRRRCYTASRVVLMTQLLTAVLCWTETADCMGQQEALFFTSTLAASKPSCTASPAVLTGAVPTATWPWMQRERSTVRHVLVGTSLAWLRMAVAWCSRWCRKGCNVGECVRSDCLKFASAAREGSGRKIEALSWQVSIQSGIVFPRFGREA
jgi:hypothetical protein